MMRYPFLSLLLFLFFHLITFSCQGSIDDEETFSIPYFDVGYFITNVNEVDVFIPQWLKRVHQKLSSSNNFNDSIRITLHIAGIKEELSSWDQWDRVTIALSGNAPHPLFSHNPGLGSYNIHDVKWSLVPSSTSSLSSSAQGDIEIEGNLLTSNLLNLSDYQNFSQLYIIELPTRPLVPGRVEITSPQFGTLFQGPISIECQPNNISRNYASHVDFRVVELIDGNDIKRLQKSDSVITSPEGEPASWFFHFVPWFHVKLDENGGDVNIVISSNAEKNDAMSKDGRDKFTQKKEDSSYVSGYPTMGYLEVVLSKEDILIHRKFAQLDDSSNDHSLFTGMDSHFEVRESNYKTTDSQGDIGDIKEGNYNGKDEGEVTTICIWGSDRMDGQKQIWIQQIQHLNPQKFTFVWFLYSKDVKVDENGKIIPPENIPEDSASSSMPSSASGSGNSNSHTTRTTKSKTILISCLTTLDNVRVVHNPFSSTNIPYEDMKAPLDDGSEPFWNTWSGDTNSVYEYISHRLSLASNKIDNMTPIWARNLYLSMSKALIDNKCDVVVFGNNRAMSSDVLITDSSRLLGIPTVMELLNLFAHPLVVPDVIVGPSVYAIQHESVTSIIQSGSSSTQISTIVIPPSVDAGHFSSINTDMNTTTTLATSFHPSCVEQYSSLGNATAMSSYLSPMERALLPQSQHNCINIGFIARLSVEKNPGLFLLTARELLSQNPSLRFTMIGDGPLKESLQSMAAQLKILHVVHFVGWVDYDAMPSILRGIDIVVNPSVRAWSETFCIANIEAMSVGIPLVTFAVGGVGQYVQPPSPQHHSSVEIEFENDDAFSIGPNAILVNHAHPSALAKAVSILITNSSLRYRIGLAGQRTSQRHFNIERQIKQYSDLYSSLVQRRFR